MTSNKKYTTESIIEKFKSIHGNRYDYSKVIYGRDQLDPIKIICLEHGEFKCTPKDHIRGRGCKSCGYKKVSKDLNKGVDYYISLAGFLHDGKYDYSNILKNYKTIHTKYSIICPKHGEFNQDLSAHIHQKAGCPKCFEERRCGFSALKWIENAKDKNPMLYILEIYDENERFIKIGITYHSVEYRYAHLNSQGYKYKILSEAKAPIKGARAIALIELELHIALSKYRYKPLKPFKGRGECYQIEFYDEIIKQFKFEVALMKCTLACFENLAEDSSIFIVNHNIL